MSIDMTLLRLGKDRKNFAKLDPGVPERGVEADTLSIWRSLGAFYQEFPDVQTIDVPTFKVWYSEFKHPSMDGDMLALHKTKIDSMAKDVPPEMESGLVDRMLTAELNVEVLDVMQKYNQGDEVDLVECLQSRIEAYRDRMNRKVKVPLVNDTLDDLLRDDESDHGVAWRLPELAKCMRRLRGGDFGILAARPDRGKTTVICSETSYWVHQLDAMWPDENRVGIWLNNEGPGRRIKQRFYQSALGCTLSEMVDYHKDGSLHKRLEEALGKDYGKRMLFYDVHDFYSHEVEAILRQHSPGFIVFDMIDNVKFSGGTSNNGQRTDQLLEEMYKWGRNLCVKHDCIGLASSQISAEGEGVPYPPQSALKDSKTGKQGACDFIIMMGALNDPNMDLSRYLGVPKNKLRRQGQRQNPQVEVIFDAERARVRSPED
jgi:replicative DNA helicase